MFEINVYVNHGYFSYPVSTVEKAMAHAEAIMSSQVYRRVNDALEVEFHHVYKVKVTAVDQKDAHLLGTKYNDSFNRT